MHERALGWYRRGKVRVLAAAARAQTNKQTKKGKCEHEKDQTWHILHTRVMIVAPQICKCRIEMKEREKKERCTREYRELSCAALSYSR